MNLPFKAGPTLDGDCFSRVRERLCLDCCKWDPQISDVSILAAFPIILDRSTVEFLGSTAERLSQEIIDAEEEILNSCELLSRLCLPSRLSSLLFRQALARNEAPRTMRFDFHFTTRGWLISEVNSDVPGGFVEASDFPTLVSSEFSDLEPTGDPTQTWTRSILARRVGDGPIALLAAPSFTADQQVVAYLGRSIARAGMPAYLCVPSQLKWRDGYAFLSTRLVIVQERKTAQLDLRQVLLNWQEQGLELQWLKFPVRENTIAYAAKKLSFFDRFRSELSREALWGDSRHGFGAIRVTSSG